MANYDLKKHGIGPWYQDHSGNIIAGEPGDKSVQVRARTLQDTKVDEILSVFRDITKELGDELWTELQWEQIRNGWVEFALELARIKIESQKAGIDESDDEYKDLDGVHIDNFDDAMKILSRNFLYDTK